MGSPPRPSRRGIEKPRPRLRSAPMTDALEGFAREEFSAAGTTHDIYRLGTGPAVIVMSEIPGITPNVAAFARRVADLGCTAIMPPLFGTPGRPASAAYATKSLVSVCISREFAG